MTLQGFGNHHQTEAIPGALPLEQNSPQHCPFGLYAEQLSGSAFTRARSQNLHSWLYRILPSASQGAYRPYDRTILSPYEKKLPPNAFRWSPLQMNHPQGTDLISSLFHLAGHSFLNTFIYHCNASMDRYFASYDGELLFIPYLGELTLHTEFGQLALSPGKIAVIPRGVYFKVILKSKEARGYICENKETPLSLPTLGFMGANALANPRHFQYPIAAFEKHCTHAVTLCKYRDELWVRELDHSPLNVVAWQGNYAPYAYHLNQFNTLNTVSYDHPDPCIFTVLSAESHTPGVANLDFVIFPPRFMVAEHTFRLPYFHRNCMSELMGLIEGQYDAKKEGFLPGGVSIHNAMIPHGPDSSSYQACINQKLQPEYVTGLAFMLESRKPWQVTEVAIQDPSFQADYLDCWQGFKPGSC
jgi:homogentisate 1,2-dioxygenase